MNSEESKAKTAADDGEGKAGEEAMSAAGVQAGDTRAAEMAATEMATGAESGESSQTDGHFSLRSLRAEAEIYALSKTLEYTGWNRRRAAQLLSISYRGILYKIRQHNLTPRGVHVPAAEQVGQRLKAE
jgi:DNA-binding NtrC family response regulator